MTGNTLIQETAGTLDLKIARVEHRLKLLEQQQVLSSPYPDFKAKVTQKKLAVQRQLEHLMQYRDVEFAE